MKLPDLGIDGRNLLKASELHEDDLGLAAVRASFRADRLSAGRSMIKSLDLTR